MKKLAALAGSAALLLSMAGPAFATWNWWELITDEATVKNYAKVKNEVDTKAFTGFNKIGGGVVAGGTIYTGAASAAALVETAANMNSLGCGCYDDLYIKNRARVRNDVETKAFTGFNKIGGGVVAGGYISTGAAGASSIVDTVVNTNLVGDVEP